MWEKALEIASNTTHPISIATVALVFVAYAFSIAIKKKRSRLVWFLAAVILLLGLAPLLASTYVKVKGVYRVRVLVLDLNKQPVDNARVISSNGGEAKKVEGGWEFDIPPQSQPADGRLMLSASLQNSFLSGHAALVLDKDYFPTVEIQLAQDTSAMVRGVVLDERRRSVAGAHVSIIGYPDIAVTDEMGNFLLHAHAAEGQIVHVRAQKGQLVSDVSVPAGNEATELVVKRP